MSTSVEESLQLVFENLGGFKRVQVLNLFHCCVIAYFVAFAFVLETFVMYESNYRCLIPECDSKYSEYQEPYLNFTIPYEDKDEENYEECSRFKHLNTSTEEDPDECTPEHFSLFRTTNCSDWIYDDQMFDSTLITEFELVCDRSFLTPFSGSSYMLGMLIGSTLLGIVADKFGRKIGLLVSTLLFGVGGVISSAAPNYPFFLVFRFLTGSGAVGLFQFAFILAVEMIGSKWRTFCGMIIEVPFALGEVSTGVIAYFIKDWRWIVACCTAPGLLLLVYQWLLSESVRWLVSQGKMDEAVKIVDDVAKVNKIPSPSHYLKKLKEEKKIDREENGNTEGSLIDLLKSPNMRNRSLILFFGWGVCTIAYYGLSTNTGNLSGNFFVNYGLTMLIEIPSYFLCYYLLDKIGRKGTLMAVLILGGVSCLVSGLMPRDLEWVIVGFSLVGKFGVAGAFGSIFVYTAELYSTEYRSIGVGACSTCARVGGILAPFVTSLSSVYEPLPLLIFGVLSFLAGALMVVLPETYGADLPQTLEQCEKFGKDQPIFFFTCCGSSKGKDHDDEEHGQDS